MVKKTKYFNYISYVQIYVQIIYLLMNILFCCFKNKLEENRNNIDTKKKLIKMLMFMNKNNNIVPQT